MKTVFLFFISIYMYSFSALGQAVLVEERGRALQSSSSRTHLSSKNSVDFKYKRKVGVGLSAAGAQGLAGVTLELNFSPEMSFSTSFGLADRFQTFGVFIKKSISAKYFTPYISGGFTRWYTVTDEGPMTTSNPSFLAERFLSNKEKSEGKFAETLIYPAMGIQYLQLDGDWAGSSLFVEVLMLVDIDDFKSSPTGGLGYLYYF
ncbi:MAG: hypothetical protein H6625_05065 [Bdellovibrionaceae bacterium]|nr:hypothetical protein [Pseudobdellovibrionaceae bacterium]